MSGRDMDAKVKAGPREFLELLRADRDEWTTAKADAFEALTAAFPDPLGPPEWGLRQIERGQFDRRLPSEWRPVFVEVYHQWLGFRAEAEAAREVRALAPAWWTRSLVPSLRRHGWAGFAASPLLIALLLLGLEWSGLAAGSIARAGARRRADAALQRAGRASKAFEHDVAAVTDLLRDGADPKLVDALAIQSHLAEDREAASTAQREATSVIAAEAVRASRAWAPPWRNPRR